MAIIIGGPASGIGLMALVPFVTHLCHQDVAKIFDFTEQVWEDDKDQRKRRRIAENKLRCWWKLISCFCIFYLATPILCLLHKFKGEKSVRQVEHYLFAIPYMNRINMHHYLGLIFAEIVLSVLAMSVIFAEPILIMAIAYELDLVVFGYRRKIQALTDIFAKHVYTSGKFYEFISPHF